jgi:hypothetical protein
MIVNDQKIFYQKNDSLFLLFENDVKDSLCFNIYDSLKSFIKDIQLKYDTTENYNNDGVLLSAMKIFIDEYQKLLFNEYLELLNITTKPKYLITSEDLIVIDSLYEVIEIKQNKINQKFVKEQQGFIEKYKLIQN